MKIAIIGYGKMGKAIEAIALQRGHRIVSKLHSNATPLEWKLCEAADVCIEFTNPHVAKSNVVHCIELGLPVVCGTTGWQNDLESVMAMCIERKGALLWSSNFSIGVNLFWEVNKRLAQLMSQYGDYAVSMEEIHHTQKKDKPSGTAITTAEQIIANNERYEHWKLLPSKYKSSEIPIKAVRAHDVKGTHTVTYESALDKIELRHEAKSRDGFAVGAVLAAEFLQNKKGVYSMQDVLKN